jgi:hypothetical protein
VCDKDVFVFGSNLAGRHATGAALHAFKVHYAIIGQGVGRQGQSYAIPTKNQSLKTLSLPTIKHYVDEFMNYARHDRWQPYYVTRIGCGLAGYNDDQIAPMFEQASDNVYFFDPRWDHRLC